MLSTWVHLRVLAGSAMLIFIVFCFVFLLYCLRALSCVPNVVIDAELSILDCPFGFL